MHWSFWCADPMVVLKRRSCLCTNPVYVPILLMHRSSWCVDPADPLSLLMCWSYWYTDPADLLILLMRWSCWCIDPAQWAVLMLVCCRCFWIRNRTFLKQFPLVFCWNVLGQEARYPFLGQGTWLRDIKSASNSGGHFAPPLLPLWGDAFYGWSLINHPQIT